MSLSVATNGLYCQSVQVSVSEVVNQIDIELSVLDAVEISVNDCEQELCPMSGIPFATDVDLCRARGDTTPLRIQITSGITGAITGYVFTLYVLAPGVKAFADPSAPLPAEIEFSVVGTIIDATNRIVEFAIEGGDELTAAGYYAHQMIADDLVPQRFTLARGTMRFLA